jgi:hypothetical protein
VNIKEPPSDLESGGDWLSYFIVREIFEKRKMISTPCTDQALEIVTPCTRIGIFISIKTGQGKRHPCPVIYNH